jgi:hypothetical protein
VVHAQEQGSPFALGHVAKSVDDRFQSGLVVQPTCRILIRGQDFLGNGTSRER